MCTISSICGKYNINIILYIIELFCARKFLENFLQKLKSRFFFKFEGSQRPRGGLWNKGIFFKKRNFFNDLRYYRATIHPKSHLLLHYIPIFGKLCVMQGPSSSVSRATLEYSPFSFFLFLWLNRRPPPRLLGESVTQNRQQKLNFWGVFMNYFFCEVVPPTSQFILS